MIEVKSRLYIPSLKQKKICFSADESVCFEAPEVIGTVVLD
jgi:hypothetical protein